MGILAKAKQLNNGYFMLSYAVTAKLPYDDKHAKKCLGKATDDDQNTDKTSPFKPEDKPRFNYSAQALLGLIITKENFFGEKAELSYRYITEKIGHSSKTTAANLEQVKGVIETTLKSTYHIKDEIKFDVIPFIICYNFLFNEELQLAEGQAPVRLSDLEAIFVSLIVNNKLNPKKNNDFDGTVKNVAKALHIPHSTAQSLIDRLIKKGVCKCYRQYTDKNGNVIKEPGEKAKTKNEHTYLTVSSRIIRRCNVIFKEYKKRFNEKKLEAEQRDTSKRKNGKQAKAMQQEPPKELTDQEKFDVIEAKFIRDKKYLALTEKYKALKEQSLDNFLKDHDEAKLNALEESAKKTFNELCYYLYGNGVERKQLPNTFARLIRNLEA